jgi:hypothetical protein
MSPSGSSKQLGYEASAGWTTYGTWRAPFSFFQGVATRHEGSFEGSSRCSNRRHQPVPKSHGRSKTPIVIKSAVDDSRSSSENQIHGLALAWKADGITPRITLPRGLCLHPMRWVRRLLWLTAFTAIY